MKKPPLILKYERTRYDSQAADYLATFSARPLTERYQAHSVMGGSAGGGESVGGGSTSQIGPDDIRLIIDALEQCDWVKWVKHNMGAQAGNNASVPPPEMPDVRPDDEEPEQYRRTRQARPRSVADRLGCGPPSFPGDRTQQRERYSREPRPKPAARPAVATPRPGEPEKERFQKLRSELTRIPKGHHAERFGKHYELQAADQAYRASRKEFADAIRDFAMVNGLGWDEAREILRLPEPLPLLPSTP